MPDVKQQQLPPASHHSYPPWHSSWSRYSLQQSTYPHHTNHSLAGGVSPQLNACLLAAMNKTSLGRQTLLRVDLVLAALEHDNSKVVVQSVTKSVRPECVRHHQQQRPRSSSIPHLATCCGMGWSSLSCVPSCSCLLVTNGTRCCTTLSLLASRQHCTG